MAATRRSKVESALVTFRGGPFAGKTARLSGDAIEQTAVFTASGMTGYYKSGVWHAYS